MPTHHHHLNCTSVSPECPVSATLYGYAPILSVNAFFTALFFTCLAIQVGLGVVYRTWTFLIALGLGCFGEGIGFVGRLVMNHNPWSQAGFKTQICCLVLAPSFLAAGVYIILRNLVIFHGPQYSSLKPRLYTWLFIGCDIGSIFIQAIGGGMAASSKNGRNTTLVKAGDNVIVTGIAFQVATMVACGVFALDFYLRMMRARRENRPAEVADHTEKPSASTVSSVRWRRRLLTFAGILSYFTILIRCIYRVPEMARGWGNPLMRNETEFLILDGMMVGIACVAMTIAHPGWTFPARFGKTVN